MKEDVRTVGSKQKKIQKRNTLSYNWVCKSSLLLCIAQFDWDNLNPAHDVSGW
jgi:hypothetical protein